MDPRRGVTVVELLVATAIAAASAAALVTVLMAGAAAAERAHQRAAALANVTLALDQLVHDLRIAGYDPSGRGVAGLELADETRVIMTADLDGDGTIDQHSRERVAYRRGSGTDSLIREVGAQAMPILSHLTPDGFRLGYHDRRGTRLGPEDPTVAAAARFVTIALGVQAGHATSVRLTGGARLINEATP